MKLDIWRKETQKEFTTWRYNTDRDETIWHIRHTHTSLANVLMLEGVDQLQPSRHHIRTDKSPTLCIRRPSLFANSLLRAGGEFVRVPSRVGGVRARGRGGGGALHRGAGSRNWDGQSPCKNATPCAHASVGREHKRNRNPIRGRKGETHIATQRRTLRTHGLQFMARCRWARRSRRPTCPLHTPRTNRSGAETGGAAHDAHVARDRLVRRDVDVVASWRDTTSSRERRCVRTAWIACEEII